MMTENPLPTVTAAPPQEPMTGTQTRPGNNTVIMYDPAELPRAHKRSGVTTNKGHGQSKARRKMAKQSRRANRGKR